MIFIDMQTFPAGCGHGQVGDVSASVPAHVPVYGFNLAGYRHEVGGLTDAAFGLIPNIEAGRASRWPWNEAAAGVQ